MKSLPVQGWSAPLTGNPLALICQIIQADDGIHGLEQARLYKPKSFCADVRMPRMNGITMLEQAGKASSGFCSCLYDSYSDKEYLQLPIHAPQAVSYIEKAPMNPSKSPRQSGKPLIFTYRNATHEEEVTIHGNRLPSGAASDTSTHRYSALPRTFRRTWFYCKQLHFLFPLYEMSLSRLSALEEANVEWEWCVCVCLFIRSQ